MSALFGRLSSDEQLGRRLAHGEAPAFDELYRRYANRLAAYGTHLLGDAAAGDDVAQVALMRAYQALREGRVPDSVGAWLYRVAHNAAIDAIRNRRELPTDLLPDSGRDQGSGGEVGALTAAIAALPERQRRVFVLRELHGLRIAETAAELGLSNTQVEQALFAARNRLAEQLVFGERLGCVAVQRLAAGPLDGRERRALKTHVRSCPACRGQLGVRGVMLSLPLPATGWLRAALGGGGAPAVAKIGAAAATLAVAGVPLSETVHPHAAPVAARAVQAAGPDVPLGRSGAQAAAAAIVRAARPAPAPRRAVRLTTFHMPTQPASSVLVRVAPPSQRLPVPAAAPASAAPSAGATAPVADSPPPQPSTEPASTEPASTEPASTEPTSTEPTPAVTDSGSDGGGDPAPPVSGSTPDASTGDAASSDLTSSDTTTSGSDGSGGGDTSQPDGGGSDGGTSTTGS